MATGPINEGVFAGTQYTNSRTAQFDLTNPKTLDEAKNAIKILLREKAELRRENDELKAEIEKAITIANRLLRKIKTSKA